MFKTKVLFIVIILISIFLTKNAYAAPDQICLTPPCPTPTTDKSVSLDNPLGENKTDINTLIGQVISGVLGIVGSLALVMFIYGGLTWMLAAGSAERVKRGRDILVWAVIGLFVVFSAYALVRFIFTDILGAQSTAQTQEYRLP